MHNALRWMIQRQGYSISKTMTVLAWESNLEAIPNLMESSFEMSSGYKEQCKKSQEDDINIFDIPTNDFGADVASERTFASYREDLIKMIRGYQRNMEPLSNVTVMVLDSATTGRLSMTMYAQMEHSEFFENLKEWHEQTAWRYWRRKEFDIFSFDLRDIVNCAYGTEQKNVLKCDDKLMPFTIGRLLPCVLQKQAFPMDLLQALCDKAAYPQAYEQKYNWDLVVACACGMLRKKNMRTKRRM